MLINLLLFRDNVPTIAAANWPAESKLFEGESTAGPVPIMFADDIESSRSAIEANVRRGHQDLQRMMRMFLMPENILLEEALAIAKKPR
jgi:hypothetical protein